MRMSNKIRVKGRLKGSIAERKDLRKTFDARNTLSALNCFAADGI